MAEPSSKPASRGGVSRLRVAGRLTALAGLPLLVLFSIFASGVYCGASRSYRVQTLEAQWLGLEPPAGTGAPAEDSADAAPALAAADPAKHSSEGDGDGAPAAQPPEAQPEAQPPEAQPPEAQPPAAQPEAQPPEAQPPPQPPLASGLLTATAEPVGPELRSRFDEARVVRVKVVVDPALVIAREDWLGYVAQLLDATDDSFEHLFGINVQLQGVVIWDMSAGADEPTLLADLAARELEGADVILGLVARARPPDFVPAAWLEDNNGDHALVFADLEQRDRYYRNLLRTLALLFGAEPSNDASSTQLGSFMSDVAPPANTPPTLDPDNRGKVIINKRRAFVTRPEHDLPQPSEQP